MHKEVKKSLQKKAYTLEISNVNIRSKDPCIQLIHTHIKRIH